MLHKYIPLLLLLVAASEPAAKRFVISDFGAVGDGKIVNTKVIQAEIDKIAVAGGGVLVVPKGTFLSGALFFKQGVDLIVEEGGVLKGTTVQADYPLVHTRWEGVEGNHTSAFLNFDGMTKVNVSGTGTIDGSGDVWVRSGRGGFGRGGRGGFGRGAGTRPTSRRFAGTFPSFQQVGRPRLVCFSNCDGVHISDVHLLNQAIWCLHLLYDQNVVVDNVHILATVYIPSSDGIDVDSSHDVMIDHCDIACYDDDIAIKSGKDDDGRRVNRPTENVTIKDCTIGIGEGIAVGSEVTGSVRHVLVENCTFNRSNTGARLKSQPSRGGVIEDITFRDIKLNNVRRAFEVIMDWDMRLERATPTNKPTVVRDIHLINYTGTASSGGLIEGLKNGPVTDMHWVNCNVTAQSGMNIVYANDLDTSGLNLKVTRGKPIIMGPATQPAGF